MATTDLQETQTLYLGRQGENEVLTVEFDLSEFVEELGAGTATLLHKRSSDSKPYIVPTTTSGNILTWTVTNTDTNASGQGTCEIRWTVGEKLKKSAIFNTTVTASLMDSSETPGTVVYMSALTADAIKDALGYTPADVDNLSFTIETVHFVPETSDGTLTFKTNTTDLNVCHKCGNVVTFCLYFTLSDSTNAKITATLPFSAAYMTFSPIVDKWGAGLGVAQISGSTLKTVANIEAGTEITICGTYLTND